MCKHNCNCGFACYHRNGSNINFHHERNAVNNLHWTDNPITVSLPDSTKVSSIHICDINIPGLRTTLMGHIIPGITMASLIRIRLLCKAGCKVVFDNKKCKLFYNNDIILREYKDPATDLWTLPITHNEVAKTTHESLSECPHNGSATKMTPQRFGPSLKCS